jgi:radial spoke head protein 9
MAGLELFDLESGLKSIASGGNVLNCQELTGVQSGMNLCKSSEKCSEIYFWGKIFGLTSDYYIAYALQDTDFEFPSKVFFFAGENFEFKPLKAVSAEVAAKVLELAGEAPLTGDPTQVLPGQGPAEGEEPAEAEEGQEAAPAGPPKLTEAERLAQVVAGIDADTSVVPKGAHMLNEAHVVVPSSDFKGLGATEATDLAKYAHFRAPTSVAALRALARTDSQFYTNFLDPLDGDLPKGCWAVRQDPSAMLVTLRSLCWPGYIAFHVPGTKKFGGAYFGYGQKCLDLPFIL